MRGNFWKAELIAVLLGACPVALAAAQSEKPAPPQPFLIPQKAAAVLDSYCYSCHDADTHKGDVRLDNMAELDLPRRLDLLNKMQEQIFFQQMPPKNKTQPGADERATVLALLTKELGAHKASTLEDKLRLPAYGNYVDHDRLFSGEITDAPYTPARRWLVSPQIFTQRINELFGIDIGSPQVKRRGPVSFPGVTNPFVMPDASGVLYYDNETLDGGILLVMLTNVDWISRRQIAAARTQGGEPKADASKGRRGKGNKTEPQKPPGAFGTIILSQTPPTDAQMTEAIRTQFAAVLRRAPSAEETARYLQLLRKAIGIGGNAEGLRQMLVAVLLQSEFLYRMEFGAGEPDRFGRKMLAPREGAYAISYALGDRSPDARLLQAAEQGRLKTRTDYQREVLRLLADKTYYEGEIDPALDGKQMKSLTVSHPRIIRFFREFFGYQNAPKIFKDPERSGFYFDNPNRDSSGTAGGLVNEADMLVNLIVEKDQHVFENLLGTEEYFVSQIPDAARKMEMLEKMYEHFKDTDWRKNPDKVIKDNLDFMSKNLPREFTQAKHFSTAMNHVARFRAKNLRPNPIWNYSFGTRLMLSANSYNFAPFDWDYTVAVQQPFKVPNRMGILTHPAWLIAHSLNTETDPVRRGRWIREKLLAGHVPDIPITVDAVVPEDHQKSLRERLEKVTSAQTCIKCHQYMNPLGLPFESYDDFGRYRTQAQLEHPENITKTIGSGKYEYHSYKTLPVDTRGVLDSTGVPALDGPVADARDLIARLVKSPRVRQSIIRHAFRFYMGRNELLSDSKTLIDADKAYVQSGGSFKAVIVSLLTSDSFLYRK